MAIETWWHGQTHCLAQMSEACCAGRLARNGRALAESVQYQPLGQGRSTRKLPTVIQRWIPRRCGGVSPINRHLQTVLLIALLCIKPSAAVFISAFENCLSPDYINSNPLALQFNPLFVWAALNTTAESHNINITVYGNVEGIATQQPYPHYDDPQWSNPNETVGKIPDVAGPMENQKYTTFTTTFNVLDYTPYNPPAVRFCNSSALTQCPLAPVFNFTGQGNR